jgi:hypothetical protein
MKCIESLMIVNSFFSLMAVNVCSINRVASNFKSGALAFLKYSNITEHAKPLCTTSELFVVKSKELFSLCRK